MPTPAFHRYVPTDRRARETLQATMAALEDLYPTVELKPKRDPLDELILTILSQATNDRNSLAAFSNLLRRFPNFRDMLECDPKEIEAAITVGGLGKVKSVRIHNVLHEVMDAVREEFPGDPPEDLLDLRFLGDYPLDQARRFLTGLGGVGEKTAACVLAFAFHREGFPVDTHIHRVLRRLGIIPERMNAEKAHHRMYELTEPDDRYALHVRMIQFGRDICHAQRPECSRCPLRPRCIFYNDLVKRGEVEAR
ncbi:MAG TPA: hypothetical protein VEI97_05905 [bacterium]|nr:hypothetical protein [bacterium]